MRNIPQTDAYVIQPARFGSAPPPSLLLPSLVPSSSPTTTTTTYLNVTTDHVTTPTCDNNTEHRPLSSVLWLLYSSQAMSSQSPVRTLLVSILTGVNSMYRFVVNL